MRMNECQCEHIDHFDGGSGHPYGVSKFPDFETALCITDYGRFILCHNCMDAGHMARYRTVTLLGKQLAAS